MIDPRFQEISEHLDAAIMAQVVGDEQEVIARLYSLREIAWSINSDILLGRWARRPRVSELRRVPATFSRRATIDDLLL